MKVVIGLGNPEKKYDGTRHNIGFEIIDYLCDEWNVTKSESKFKGKIIETFLREEKVLLVKPMTYMNLSGECVSAILKYYPVANKDIIVIYDDISLDVGKIRIREKGSAGGHNGIKSIIAHLHTEEFARIKIGVGEKPKDWDLADYVLGKFKKEEQEKMQEAIKKTEEALNIMILESISVAMNKCNG